MIELNLPRPRFERDGARARAGASRRRGVAIVIMVLGALTILTVMLTEFQDETTAELRQRAQRARRAQGRIRGARARSTCRGCSIAAEPTIRKALGAAAS